MKMPCSFRGHWVACLVLLTGAGCETVSTSGPNSSQVQNPNALPVVIVSIATNYDGPNVVVNGFNAGYAPRDIYLEVNPDGTLPYAVTISVDPSGSSDSRAAAMLGSSRGPRILTKSYGPGKVPPRKIYFDPVAIREEGQASDLAKPGTQPTARRMD